MDEGKRLNDTAFLNHCAHRLNCQPHSLTYEESVRLHALALSLHTPQLKREREIVTASVALVRHYDQCGDCENGEECEEAWNLWGNVKGAVDGND